MRRGNVGKPLKAELPEAQVMPQWVHFEWPRRSDFIMQVTGQDNPMVAPQHVAELVRDGFTLRSAHYEIPPSRGTGHWGLLQLAPDLLVVTTRATYADRLLLSAAGEDFIEFYFHLAGRVHWNEGQDSGFVLEEPTLTIIRQGQGREVPEIIEGGMPGASVVIYCRPSALTRIFGDYRSSLSPATAAALGEQFEGLFALRVPLYPALSRPAIDLVNLEASRANGLAYVEALVQQTLCEIFELLALQPDGTPQTSQLSDADIRCLRLAREILMGENTPPPSITTLGRRVGLSPTKLKRGFRALFGVTVYDFAQRLRMERGLTMLRRGSMPLALISEALGYQFQTSFTSAFRRQYGVLPKDVRRNPSLVIPGKNGEKPGGEPID